MLQISIAIVLVITLWAIYTQNKLEILDENVNNAMIQIQVQISSLFDALMILLEMTKDYAKNGSEKLIETIKSERNIITAESAPDDVFKQEEVILQVLSRVAMVAQQNPGLNANRNYIKTMGKVEALENMLRTSRLIYNSSVTKLNREIRKFPVPMIAGILGFSPREYLEEQTANADMSGYEMRFLYGK